MNRTAAASSSRFFDRDGDSTLNYSEYRVLVAAIRRNKKQLIDPISVNQETETLFKAMGLPPETGNISLADFLQAIGTLKIRGTSQLLRSPIGIQQYLYTLQGRGKPAIQTVFKTMEINNQLAKQSMTHHKDNYSIGTHLVNIQKSGTVITFEKVNGTQLLSASSTQQSIYKNSSKRVSQEMFAELSLSNETLSSLRYLIQNNKHLKALNKGAKGKEAFEYSWGTLDYAHFGKNFLLICGQVKEIFKSETRLIDVQAPAYILGDLHGNFNSLMYFEKVLWHLGIGLCPSNIVFLGDYVDRGPHSMEVIAYLFSYKIEAPRKLTLLRGNHEIRDIQKLFTFYAYLQLLHKGKLLTVFSSAKYCGGTNEAACVLVDQGKLRILKIDAT
ncbi:hypothetical protein FQR65_LT18503 [Abscondita terminalis]|nr:hypothetical protein FQR65_LT18503 [Abscondita terminalis]